MRWRILLAGIFLLSGGCKTGTKLIDPLVGSTRIEPPRTGSVVPPPDPFYPGQSSQYRPGGAGLPASGQSSGMPSGPSPTWTPLMPSNTGYPQGQLPSSPASLPSTSGGTEFQPRYPTNGGQNSSTKWGTEASQHNGLPSTGPNSSASSAMGFPSPPTRITIPTSPAQTSSSLHNSAASGRKAPSAYGSEGLPPLSSGLSAPAAQPIIRTLQPRNSQAGYTAWAGASDLPGSGGSAGGATVSHPPAAGASSSGASPSPSYPSGGNSFSKGSSRGAEWTGSVDLASLPPAGSLSGHLGRSSLSSLGGGIASLGSGAAGLTSPAGGMTNKPSAPAPTLRGSAAGQAPAGSLHPYGFDPQYQWLRGVLCYSPTEGCWRLRYVAPGCPPDRLGGWVILCHPTGLVGFCPGEQVEVRGQLIYKQYGNCQLPIYQVQDIRRVRA